MSQNLSHADFLEVANSLHIQNKAFIDGEFVDAINGETTETYNPATGKLITQVAACDKEDVDLAVEASRRAFNSGVWAKKHPSERKKIIHALCDLIRKNAVELAVLETIDSGKPVSECLNLDIPETIAALEWHAELADKSYDSLAPSSASGIGMIVREPIGVVGCVVPWNFPLMTAAMKIGPALAEGNSVIVKPATITALTILRLAELMNEAGVPKGVFNVIPGLGHTAGAALGLHPGIDAISFTGSTAVGRKFLQYSAETNLKKTVLELGGKSPFVLLDDVQDLSSAVEHAAAAAYWNMGENCTGNSRIILPRARKDEFVALLIEELKKWKTGDPLDPQFNLGSMVSKEHFASVMSYIEKGKAEGATVVVGGEPMEIGSGLFIPPTIFDNVDINSTIAREEIFGPVTCIMPVDSNEEALALANDTEYGLQATLFTNDLKKAHSYASALQAGTVSVNCFSEGDSATPFGGYKLSGFGGKDKGAQAHDQYTETKTIWINME